MSMRGKENTAKGGHDATVSGSQVALGGISPQEELRIVEESLHQIEAILTAESKRRQQANNIQREYIETYLDKLE